MHTHQAQTDKIVLDPDYSIKPLVMAVILQAVMEASEGSAEAAQWLTDEAPTWLDSIGSDLGAVSIARWVSGDKATTVNARKWYAADPLPGTDKRREALGKLPKIPT